LLYCRIKYDERLSRSEIIKGIHLLKVHPTEEEAENIMEELDLDGMDKLQFCKKKLGEIVSYVTIVFYDKVRGRNKAQR
jgi:Ca2+-binding EF-hand superfamily protein